MLALPFIRDCFRRCDSSPEIVSRISLSLKQLYRQVSSTEYVAKTATMPRYTVIEDHKVTATMKRTVYVEQREDIPDDASVFHYDELDEEFKDRFPELIENTPTKEFVCPESVLSNGDYVKFTDYYRIICG
jgi:hypothetical protein